MSDFLGLRDHVIVVPGAASGMGQAIARAADREGARLVPPDVDAGRLKATASDLAGDVRHVEAALRRMLPKGFARALVGTGIRINCVNPAPATRRCTRR